MVEAGGPDSQDYPLLSWTIGQLGDEVRAGTLDREELRELIREISLHHFPGTMQAASILKKHGYSGDFEIIDGIYQVKIVDAPHLRRWDLFSTHNLHRAPYAIAKPISTGCWPGLSKKPRAARCGCSTSPAARPAI